jgi:hypothetical protein
MLGTAVIGSCGEDHTEDKNRLCGQTAEVLSVKKRVVRIVTTVLYKVNVLCR